jgi:hypothetical protein
MVFFSYQPGTACKSSANTLMSFDELHENSESRAAEQTGVFLGVKRFVVFRRVACCAKWPH